MYQYSIDDKRKTKRFRRKANAKAFMEALTAGQSETVIEQPSIGPQKAEPITVGEWMERWLEKYAKPMVKLSTYCSYEQLIRGHIKPQIGGRYMNTLTGEDLQNFFNERRTQGNLKGEGGLSTKTLTNLRNMMHLAFGQAVKNKLLTQNLVEGVHLPKAEKHEMRVLDREEQTRLTLAARRAPKPAAFGIIFDLFTGLRMGELCGLRWENVDMESRSFKVCETRNHLPNFDDSIETSTSVATVKTTKTDNSRRTVFIIDGLYQDFVDYRTIQMSLQKQHPGYNLSAPVIKCKKTPRKKCSFMAERRGIR